MPPIYEPSDDSYLMSENLSKEVRKLLRKNPELKVLEIGVGSGINLQAVLKAGVNKKNIFGSDINNNAVKLCKKLGFNIVLSDLFEKIKGKYDLITFNPPYLPLDKKEPRKSRIATTGGVKGNEIIIKFLKQAKKHLTEDGKIFLITSSLAEEVNFAKLGYQSKEIAHKNLFFERLFVWELGIR